MGKERHVRSYSRFILLPTISDGEAADLSVYSNINVVAGTLKLYLRLLPVPLVTYEVHPKFIQAIRKFIIFILFS